MRRLLIKLVAIETALVGWLAYWLFLVYANNPAVAEGLGAQLSKFPQLSFTTVDITVLVIIGILAIFLAFKFQRGLKPGIRLERALQMLENLMKRNLILEAQVAEMKLDRAQVATPALGLPSTEPRVGSWEKAFRTPIEAGPPGSLGGRSTGPSATEAGFEHETGTLRATSQRTEPRPVPQTSAAPKQSQGVSEKLLDKTGLNPERTIDKAPISIPGTGGSPIWEDSPKYLGESSGILTPSGPPRKQGSAISEPISPRQPYVPAPVPKAVPPSVILGPGVSPGPTARPLARLPSGARPVASPQSIQRPGPIVPPPSAVSLKPSASPQPTSSSMETTRPTPSEKAQAESTATLTSKDISESPAKPTGKPSSTKKRFPWEDN